MSFDSISDRNWFPLLEISPEEEEKLRTFFANLSDNDSDDCKSNMPFYRAVMSLSRFEQLSRYIRFDDSRSRVDRLRQDKLAPIRYVWDLFQKNLTLPFVSSLEMVIDEQLLTTRNRCSFKQYIPSKPGKYGIKIFWMVDSKTNYPLSAEVYLGQQPNQNRTVAVAHDLVLRLAKNYFYLGANITMDNFFVSYQLAEDLIGKDITITGTIRSNKRELPPVFTSAKEAKKRGENSAIFCFSNSCQLTSYTTNTNKNVLLLSTAHVTEDLHAETGKPVIIHDYNEHKGGVDTFDKMLRAYTCKRRCSRWPMLLFFNMLDVAALAAYRLYELSNPSWKANNHDKRKIFLKELLYELAHNELDRRSKIANLAKSTKIAMDLIGFKPKEVRVSKRKMPDVQVKNPARRCEECKKDRQTKDNKTTAVCDLCLKPHCSIHYIRSCEGCYMRKFNDPDALQSGEDDKEGDTEPDVNDAIPSTHEPRAKRPRSASIINL